MSRNPAIAGVEFSTTLEARRSSIAAIGLLNAAGALFVLVTQYSYFPVGQARVTLVQIPLIALILIFRRRDLGAWFGILSLLVSAIGTVFTVDLSDARISASTVLFIAAYCGIVMLQGAWQAIWIIAVAALWTQITPTVAIPFDFGRFEVNLRWATWVQLLIACTWTLMVWNREYSQLAVRDDAAMRVARRRADALAVSERLRVWRDSLVRVHETVLNDIRSVVEASHIDGARLARQLRSSEAFAPPAHNRISLSELIRPLNVMQSEQRLIIGRLPDVHLSQERAATLRSALLEIMRNAYRHAGVTSLHVEAVADSHALHLSIFSDSNAFEIPQQGTGIGTGVVLRDALTELDATLSQTYGAITVQLPWEVKPEPALSTPDIDAGRALLSAVGAGNALGGAAFYVAVAMAHGWQGIVIAISASITAVVSVIVVWRRRNVSPALLIGTAATSLIVPLIAPYVLDTCSRIELPLITTALTSLGFFAVVVWAPNPRWWIIGVPFLIALTSLSQQAMPLCTAGVAPALLSAFSAPALMGLTLVTTTISLRRNAQLERLQLAEVRDAAAAEAAEQLSGDLHAAITTARSLLAEITRTEDVSAAQRLKLRCVDSEIRATIQVDPETSGGMSRAARTAIHDAANKSVPTRVLVLRDSGDRRELPSAITDALGKLLEAATDDSASIQILSNNHEDVLTLTLSETARQRSGLPDGWTCEFESGIATLDAGTTGESALFLVRRDVLTREPDSSTHPAPALSR